MNIKTGNEIYFEGCDVREQSKERNYDNYSTQKRKEQHEMKWVSVESLLNILIQFKKQNTNNNEFDKQRSIAFGDIISSVTNSLEQQKQED